MQGPGLYELQGFAWSGNGTIKAVDITTDGGRTWRTADLEGPVLNKCLTRFRYRWNWDGGPAKIASRAVDSTGYVQPTVAELAANRRDGEVARVVTARGERILVTTALHLLIRVPRVTVGAAPCDAQQSGGRRAEAKW